MPNRTVTMNAIDRLFARLRGQDVVNHALVAMQAVVLQDAPILATDHDRFMKVLQREAFGMPETVFGFGEILGGKGVRKMAINTRGDAVMACLLPAIELRLHDVAIDTGFGIGAEVREAFRVVKRV